MLDLILQVNKIYIVWRDCGYRKYEKPQEFHDIWLLFKECRKKKDAFYFSYSTLFSVVVGLETMKMFNLGDLLQGFSSDAVHVSVLTLGGLGEAVSSAMVNESGFTVHRLAVSHIPRSGKPHELLKVYGIDRDAIIQGVRKMLSSSTNAK